MSVCTPFERAPAAPISWSEAVRSAVIGALIVAFDKLATWQNRASQRHRLATLDDHALSDLGIGRADIARETSKSFWQG